MPLLDVYQIDLPTAKTYLRVDHDTDDVLIQLLADSAVEKVGDYLNQEYVYDDDVPARVKLACFRLLADWYDNRDTVTTRLVVGGGPGSTQKEIGVGPWTLGEMLADLRVNPGT